MTEAPGKCECLRFDCLLSTDPLHTNALIHATPGYPDPKFEGYTIESLDTIGHLRALHAEIDRLRPFAESLATLAELHAKGGRFRHPSAIIWQMGQQAQRALLWGKK